MNDTEFCIRVFTSPKAMGNGQHIQDGQYYLKSVRLFTDVHVIYEDEPQSKSFTFMFYRSPLIKMTDWLIHNSRLHRLVFLLVQNRFPHCSGCTPGSWLENFVSPWSL
jgi:hypothetical protein